MSRRNKYPVIWLLATITLFTHKDEFIKLTRLYIIPEEENAKGEGKQEMKLLIYIFEHGPSFIFELFEMRRS